MRTNNTIAAIATSLSPAGIGIIRISGEEATEIADRVFRGSRSLKEADTHTVNYGFIYDKSNIRSNKTVFNAHMAYWRKAKFFAKEVVKAYEEGLEVFTFRQED